MDWSKRCKKGRCCGTTVSSAWQLAFRFAVVVCCHPERSAIHVGVNGAKAKDLLFGSRIDNSRQEQILRLRRAPALREGNATYTRTSPLRMATNKQWREAKSKILHHFRMAMRKVKARMGGNVWPGPLRIQCSMQWSGSHARFAIAAKRCGTRRILAEASVESVCAWPVAHFVAPEKRKGKGKSRGEKQERNTRARSKSEKQEQNDHRRQSDNERQKRKAKASWN